MIKNNLIYLSLFLLLNSCATFIQPSIIYQGSEMKSVSGKQVTFNVIVTVTNPNKYKLIVDPSKIDVAINDAEIGQVSLNQKIVLPKKDSTTVTLPLEAQLKDGALTTLFMSVMKEEVSVHVKGKIKGGRPFFKHKFKLDKTFHTSGKNLKLGKP